MALNHEAIRQRLHLLEGYVQQLHSYHQHTLAEVRGDMSLTWAIEHGLQLSIQCVIDVCHYLVAVLALGTPATSQEAIELLRDAGIFPAAFASTLVQMVRFRNILVHVYAQVDVGRVYENLHNHLGDLGEKSQQPDDSPRCLYMTGGLTTSAAQDRHQTQDRHPQCVSVQRLPGQSAKRHLDEVSEMAFYLIQINMLHGVTPLSSKLIDHCVYNLHYHLVVVTKYRRKCLTPAMRDTLKSLCASLL